MITVKKIGTQQTTGDGSDMTNVYLVTDNGREFRITCRTHRHGGNLGLAGAEGILYTDRDENRVRRQVIAVGKICGISIESDEPVEGLSPWSLSGVVMADRSREIREITLLTEGPDGACDQPVILIDGKVTDLQRYL